MKMINTTQSLKKHRDNQRLRAVNNLLRFPLTVSTAWSFDKQRGELHNSPTWIAVRELEYVSGIEKESAELLMQRVSVEIISLMIFSK
tara:strand:+ start:659 stop:922 length:264 start_codon:yes stop_codon:yes gene_type:complete